MIIIRFVMESKFYRKLCETILKITTPIVDYLTGIYTEPKYIALRYFFAGPWFPDENILIFMFLTKLKII